MADLDAHEKPPSTIRDTYKVFQKATPETLEAHPGLIDPYETDASECTIRLVSREQLPCELEQILQDFAEQCTHDNNSSKSARNGILSAHVLEAASIPGLLIYPSLLSPAVQINLLQKLFHRDLSNPKHRTNVHMHYNVPYPAPYSHSASGSYFDSSTYSLKFEPKDLRVHKAFTTQQYLNRKLRWMTLGGQYDWTNKAYPQELPPTFPPDIKNLIEGIFPMKAEAAIVNLYSPGDTLGLHRDVSEDCDKPLVSISLGCDGIFVAGLGGNGPDGELRVAVMRLRSGDAVLMSDESRYAWHGVPKVVEGTCPDWMQDWPGGDDDKGRSFEQWKGWMKEKRINLNVRQMFG